MSDYLRDLVDTAVAAQRKGPSKEAFESLAPLAELEPTTLLPELFLQIEEAANTVDLNDLRSTELGPDADFARKVVGAVTGPEPSPSLLREVVQGGYAELVVSLLSVVSMLKDSADAQQQQQEGTAKP